MFKLKKGRTDNDCRFFLSFCCLFIRFVFSDSKKQAKNTAHHFRASDHNNFHIDSLPAELSYQPLYLTTNKIPKQPNEMATKTVAAPEDKTSAVTMPAANARAHFPQQRTCSQRSLGAQNIVFASLSCKTEQKKLRYLIIYRKIKSVTFFLKSSVLFPLPPQSRQNPKQYGC